MQNLTLLLQNDIKGLMDSFTWLKKEAKDIGKLYWKTEANTYISGLSAGTDAATVNTKLDKDEFLAGITLCEQIGNMFENGAVSQADYNATIQRIKHGNTSGATNVPVAAESIGDRLLILSQNMLGYYQSCVETLELYFDNEIGDMVTVLDAHRVVFGANMTKQECVLGVTLLGQYTNLIGNSSVTTGDYASTLAKWLRITGS